MLEALDEAGYVNMVGLRGGYNGWSRTWDGKWRRRNLPGTFVEEYQHGADTCGVHATGGASRHPPHHLNLTRGLLRTSTRRRFEHDLPSAQFLIHTRGHGSYWPTDL